MSVLVRWADVGAQRSLVSGSVFRLMVMKQLLRSQTDDGCIDRRYRRLNQAGHSVMSSLFLLKDLLIWTAADGWRASCRHGNGD